MTKTQTKQFALQVQDLITAKFNLLEDASDVAKLNFFQHIKTFGKTLHLKAEAFINDSVNIWSVQRQKIYKHSGYLEELEELEDLNSGNDLLDTFYWATELEFCMNMSFKHGYTISELIERFHSELCNYFEDLYLSELEELIYNYFANQVILQNQSSVA